MLFLSSLELTFLHCGTDSFLSLTLFFFAKVRLSLTLTFSHLIIWTDGSVSFFFLEKTFLQTADFVALRPLF